MSILSFSPNTTFLIYNYIYYICEKMLKCINTYSLALSNFKSLDTKGRNVIHTSTGTQITTPDPAGIDRASLVNILNICSNAPVEVTEVSPQRGRYRANQSVSITTIVNKHDICGRMCFQLQLSAISIRTCSARASSNWPAVIVLSGSKPRPKGPAFSCCFML